MYIHIYYVCVCLDIRTYTYLYMYLYICKENGNGKLYKYIHAADLQQKNQTENGRPGNFPSSVCSSCKRKFVLCPFFDEETNGSFPCANELDGLTGLAHLLYAYMLTLLSLY